LVGFVFGLVSNVWIFPWSFCCIVVVFSAAVAECCRLNQSSDTLCYLWLLLCEVSVFLGVFVLLLGACCNTSVGYTQVVLSFGRIIDYSTISVSS